MSASWLKSLFNLSISSTAGGSSITGGSSLLSNSTIGWMTTVRNASKKASGSSRNKPGRPRGKHRGIKKRDGTWVTKGTILVRQLGLLFHPGLNVGIGSDKTLFAREHGKVVMTTEKMNPNWDHSFIKRFYPDLQNQDVPIYKTYFHILAESPKQTFKLVDQI
nr:39S ribosomal protein L27, mitochondrial-like [Procambarus clarkii]